MARKSEPFESVVRWTRWPERPPKPGVYLTIPRESCTGDFQSEPLLWGHDGQWHEMDDDFMDKPLKDGCCVLWAEFPYLDREGYR